MRHNGDSIALNFLQLSWLSSPPKFFQVHIIGFSNLNILIYFSMLLFYSFTTNLRRGKLVCFGYAALGMYHPCCTMELSN